MAGPSLAVRRAQQRSSEVRSPLTGSRDDGTTGVLRRRLVDPLLPGMSARGGWTAPTSTSAMPRPGTRLGSPIATVRPGHFARDRSGSEGSSARPGVDPQPLPSGPSPWALRPWVTAGGATMGTPLLSTSTRAAEPADAPAAAPGPDRVTDTICSSLESLSSVTRSMAAPPPGSARGMSPSADPEEAAGTATSPSSEYLPKVKFEPAEDSVIVSTNW